MQNTELITPEQCRQAAISRGLKRYNVRSCSICGERLGYEFATGDVVGLPSTEIVIGFDANCGCTSFDSGIRRGTWLDLADHFNRIPAPKRSTEFESFTTGGVL